MLKFIITIKNNLSEILGKKRMKMSELQITTGLSYSTINDLYHNKTTSIGFDTVDKICDALEITVGELFEHVPNSGN